ncbi:MAG: TrkA C-terminal domain-containing protein, partial [Candidatus Heimdallarchaeaceae archaeon]
PFELLEEVVDDSSESVDYIPITKDSPYVGKTVKEAEQTDDFFQILAVRKRGKYFFFPEDKVKINVGDGLIIKAYSSPEDE